MPSDYDAITRRNEERLGTDTASRKTQLSLYSNATQFVYEILRNADDCGATEVFFKLLGDSIVIEHNGKPFTPEDVEGITYFGKSTSRDDFVKAGHFGIGFKSVFAVTATPIIISGDEHFKIYGLYRVREYPDSVSENPAPFDKLSTRIILPFNHETEKPDFIEELMSPKKAYQRIEECLSKPDMNTLLFTRSVQKFRWETYDRYTRYLQKIPHGDRVVHIDANEQLVRKVGNVGPATYGSMQQRTKQGGIQIQVQVDGSSTPNPHEYLRFEKNVAEETNKPKHCRISVAFGREWNEGKWKFIRLEPGQVFIEYFPAAKERSGLGSTSKHPSPQMPRVTLF